MKDNILEMLKTGLHFGHRPSKWHPKMKQYIFGIKGGVHIIDLEKTISELDKALNFIEDLSRKGGKILFVGTKSQIRKIMKDKALEVEMPYIEERWLGGTITNFNEILKVIKKYNDLRKKKDSGELEKYTKKEQSMFTREIEKLERMVGGISGLKKIPEALFVVDVKKEKTAVREAVVKNIPVVALCDTNINPSKIAYVIPGNDDSVKGVKLIVEEVGRTIMRAKSDPSFVKQDNK